MQTLAASGGGKPAPGADDDLIGVTVGSRYAILDVLGEGGMATVYDAYDESEQREVAVKVMNPGMAKEEALRQRFRNEAQATMTIVDPHVVEITDFGELDDGTPYYVMERLVGHPLDEYAEGWPMPVADVLHIGTQICRGLAAAHAKGFIHRDLKPENIFIEVEDGVRVKVLDFGVAKVPSSNLTVPGSVFGTPCYMSPEQAVPRREVDQRTDIYSLGIILYELLTGDVPFGCGDPIQVMLSHVGQAPDPVRRREPSVPPAVARVIDRCLRKKPEERYQTMVSLCEALEAAVYDTEDDESPVIEVEEAPGLDVNKTILFDPSKLDITIDDLLADMALAPAASKSPASPTAATTVEPMDVLREARLPTPPGPQPWQPKTSRSWMWSCMLLLPLLFAAIYLALG